MLTVYALAAVAMILCMVFTGFFSPSAQLHTYLVTPSYVNGFQQAPATSFTGVEQALRSAFPGVQRLSAEYDDTAGQPRAYVYADKSIRAATAIPSAMQETEAVLQRELPGGDFGSETPGSLGGRLACANATILGQPASECVFADTFATGAFILVAQSDAAGVVMDVRQMLEVRATRDPAGTGTSGSHSSRTGTLVGGSIMAVLALLAVLYGPRFLDFIQQHPELQVVPALVNPDANITFAKWAMRITGVVLTVAGIAFVFTAL